MGKKRNKKAIIITAIAMLAGVLLILTGLFGDRIAGLFYEQFDFKSIGPESTGMNVETNLLVYYYDVDLTDKSIQFVGDLEGDGAFIVLDLSGLSENDRNTYFSNYGRHITVQGTLRAVDDEEFKEIEESLYRFFDPAYLEAPDPDFTLEQFHQFVIEPVMHYCIDVRSVGSFDWKPFLIAGAVILVISLILEICFVFKLKKRIILPVVFGIVIIVPVVLFFNHIRTALSVKKISDDLYTMKNLECTDTRGMLDSGAGSVNEFFSWIFDNHMYGIQYDINEENFKFGCSAFSAVTPEGDHLFGRNFDYIETETLMIYSHPDGCYESIGIADIGVFGVGRTYPVSPDSPSGRMFMVIAPYIVVDGMNEKGVGTGILQLSIDETHQDNGKPDLLIYCAVRAILDKCASVDEALALLDSYDIHSDLGESYHLFITDRTGRYVVVEWLDGEMTVVEHQCCTNSVVAPGMYYDMGDPDDRLPTMEECLASGRTVTESEAMDILAAVKSNRFTEWSCVYNLDDFTVSICTDGDYENVYTFSPEDLK